MKCASSCCSSARKSIATVAIARAQEHDLLELRQSSVFSADAQARCRVLERVVRLRNDLDDRAAELEAIEALSEQAMPLADDRWKAVTLAAKAEYHRSVGRVEQGALDGGFCGCDLRTAWRCLRAGRRRSDGGCAAAFMADFDDADAPDRARSRRRARERGRRAACKGNEGGGRRCESCVRITQRYKPMRSRHWSSIVPSATARGRQRRTGSRHRCRQQLWQVEDARRHFKCACDLYEALGERGELGEALMNAGDFERELGCLDKARALMERAAVLLEGSGATHLVDICLENLAEIAGECEDAPSCCGLLGRRWRSDPGLARRLDGYGLRQRLRGTR